MKVSVPQLCLTLATPWTVARQAPPSMGFSRQEYWSGLPPGDLPNPGIEPRSPALQADSLSLEPRGKSLALLIYPACLFFKMPATSADPKFYDLQFYFFWKKQNILLHSEVQDLLLLDSLLCMNQGTTELISLSQRSPSPSHSRGMSAGSRPLPGPGGPSHWLVTCRCRLWEVPVPAPDCLVLCCGLTEKEAGGQGLPPYSSPVHGWGHSCQATLSRGYQRS